MAESLTSNELRAEFERFCSRHGSSGASTSNWYWMLWQAGAEAQTRLAHEPSSVAVNEPVFYRCETCKEIMLAAHLVGTDSHERIEETSEGQPYQVTCGPVRPSVLSAGEYINRFLPANWMNDSSLETWFPITAEELKRLKDERAAQPPSTTLHEWNETEWSFPVRFLEAVKKAAPPDIFAPSLEGIECALLGYERATGVRLDDSVRVETMHAVTKSTCQHDLLAPNPTVTVDPTDPFAAHCDACGYKWRTRPADETSATLPHKQCKTPSECRREQVCLDAWHCASESENSSL